MYWFRANFQFPVLMFLHGLGCPEHDLTIFEKCLCVSVTKFCDKCSSRKNEQNFMKLYI